MKDKYHTNCDDLIFESFYVNWDIIDTVNPFPAKGFPVDK